MTGKGFGFGGFSIQSKKAVAPQMNFVPASTPRVSTGHMINIGRKRVKSEEEYFEDEDEERTAGAPEYLPAPGSPGPEKEDKSSSGDEDDPLDLYMENIDKEVKKLESGPMDKKGKRDDIELEDDQEAYFR